ncbi:MAG: quinone-dependent dihydroorotate dehydrogenase [Elusimicrobiota bacterium]
MIYKNLLKPFIFNLDPEGAHNLTVSALKRVEAISPIKSFFSRNFSFGDPKLKTEVLGIEFPNPVGLGAGFDKKAELLSILPTFGFGFIEVGTITPLPQEGQEKPRLFRFPQHSALVNRMGFNNPGMNVALDNIKKDKKKLKIPLGINIGKGKMTPLNEAFQDYGTAFEKLSPLADYVVINVSSPNTPNLRALQQIEPLRNIIEGIRKLDPHPDPLLFKERGKMKPLFIKISPDGDDALIEAIVALAIEFSCGIIATNTTIDKSSLGNRGMELEGGLSGAPLKEKSNATLKKIAKLAQKKIPIIGVGGIFSAEDAYQKIKYGSSLVQIYSGWVYEGPSLVATINKGLLRLLERDGFKNISAAVGVEI